MAVVCTIALSGPGAGPAARIIRSPPSSTINKPIKLTGKVTMMRWSNPHAWIYLDVKGTDGKVVNWAFETGGANALYRRGTRPEDFPVGTQVTIDGWLARNGTPTATSGKAHVQPTAAAITIGAGAVAGETEVEVGPTSAA